MVSRMRTHLRTNVVAYLALFFAFGGVSYAAVDLAKNSVGPREIEKNAVGKSEIANNAVLTGEVKDGSLLCADFEAAQPACKPDAVGLIKTTVRSHTETLELTCRDETFEGDVSRDCDAEETVKVSCAAGEQATGGGPGDGSEFESADKNTYSSGDAYADRPDPVSGTPTGWVARGSGYGYSSGTAETVQTPPNPTVTVHAVCAS